MNFWRLIKRFWDSKGKKPLYTKPQGAREPALTGKLETDVRYLKEAFGHVKDLKIRNIENRGQKVALAFLETITNNDIINRDILAPLTNLLKMPLRGGRAGFFRSIPVSLHASEVKEERFWPAILHSLVNGRAVLMADGCRHAFLISTEYWDKRPIEEPRTEATVRGPREGLVEDLNSNIALIRRRLRAPELRFEIFTLGRRSRTGIAVVYLEGVALEGVLAELRHRLKRIDIDGIISDGYLEELLEEAPFSPFPQIFRTERPDVVAAEALQGRIFILTDGSPFALGVPSDLFLFLHAPDDYYERWPLAIGLRLFRLLGIFTALLLPSLYVALTTFHQEMIPTSLAIAIASQREPVPYPAFVEALTIQIVFEILIEAGVRLPRTIGPAISIVGALVIGTAAVQAGLISATMVIVISATAIASFTIPIYGLAQAVRLLRLPMIVLAAVLGLFGIFAGLLAILIHLTSIRNFGLPYLAPLAPFFWEDERDMLVRAPWWAMQQRPVIIGMPNLRRQKPGLRPGVDPRQYFPSIPPVPHNPPVGCQLLLPFSP